MAELMRRYVVMTMATEAPFDPLDPEGVFVLKPWKDPAALRALTAYKDNCYPELARDLDAWIRAIEAGPIVRGDVGLRNESFVTVSVTAADGSESRPRRAAGRSEKRQGKRPAARRKTHETAKPKPKPKTTARGAAAKQRKRAR